MSDDENHPQVAAEVDDLLAAAYALDTPEANRALYARWAATYESGFIADSGYRYHEHVARIFAEHCLADIGPGETVLDIGCGTGLAGHALRRIAPVTIDGLDISPEMLAEAAAKREGGEAVYRRLVEADLTEPLPIPDFAYAGALSVGTFTHGHVGPVVLHEVIRIIRPGGRLAIGVNAAHFMATGFASVLDELVGTGRILGLQLIDTPIYAPIDTPADTLESASGRAAATEAAESDLDQIGRVVTFTVAAVR
jgi:SAM-dependent methyltransferase